MRTMPRAADAAAFADLMPDMLACRRFMLRFAPPWLMLMLMSMRLFSPPR